jgi:carboxyl-terminal processing protease
MITSTRQAVLLLPAFAALLALAACGGDSGSSSGSKSLLGSGASGGLLGGGSTGSNGSGSSGGSNGSGSSGGSGSSTYTSGVFLPESTFAAKCATPRSGTDPFTHVAYPDLQGTSVDENNWLRSWTNDLYLWYSEVPDLNPGSYTTALYFPLLKTSATTASGNPKDKFHFTYTTQQWESLSQSNTDVGYGVQFDVVQPTPPRKIVLAFTEAGSAASQAPASLARGATVLQIDGVDINTTDSGGVDTLNAGLARTTVGESHTFQVLDRGGTTPRTVTLQAANVTTHSVPTFKSISTPTGPVGYLLFNNQLAQAETELVSAVNGLKSMGVTDLVLDIRYNGGGYLDIASELAYMIAGPAMTAGQTFELVQFNSKHPTTDPVTGNAITPTGFHTTTGGFSLPSNQALPTLNLQRVYVLTTSATCSASEAVMNSLQGVGVQVIQVGKTTCGKPYGFYPTDNCGTTYFSIQFRGVNAKGFGDYSDGFTPSTTMTTDAGNLATLPGCSVDDDFTHDLGDQNESLLFSALSYQATQSCGTPPAGLAPGAVVKRITRDEAGGYLIRSPMREIRILRPTT